ncbi:3-isopropylmalate dehydratase small subunit [Parashewanella spongiae]|uniref:3-isopropylmalate dehydratase small subunit n=1 Tax=Parashewanella spongiae TaxID=342950 RepID=A0A3A6U0R7_9GAMM|nr:3-isopropylmalate dehydratase small subunit [Parashewanella spongiae]MCL1077921.1 3-isopropylmalate dehydratase small subunit [Parashewanella spongiae]RJY17564.1 3-isopropylmalate dehydratase small subunit [Parashewanella spongiae]
MDKFIKHSGIVAPLNHANVDTDQIIPKQFLQKTERVGFGQHLFHDWRYLDNLGNISNPDFVLNAPKYKGASVLIARENFGCGSSREHAPWALQEYGFKVIIAPSFADIFYGNSINIGVLPIILSESEVEQIFSMTEREVITAEVNLPTKTLTVNGILFTFSIEEVHQKALLDGVDSIGKTLKCIETIKAYEQKLPVWQ